MPVLLELWRRDCEELGVCDALIVSSNSIPPSRVAVLRKILVTDLVSKRHHQQSQQSHKAVCTSSDARSFSKVTIPSHTNKFRTCMGLVEVLAWAKNFATNVNKNEEVSNCHCQIMQQSRTSLESGNPIPHVTGGSPYRCTGVQNRKNVNGLERVLEVVLSPAQGQNRVLH